MKGWQFSSTTTIQPDPDQSVRLPDVQHLQMQLCRRLQLRIGWNHHAAATGLKMEAVVRADKQAVIDSPSTQGRTAMRTTIQSRHRNSSGTAMEHEAPIKKGCGKRCRAQMPREGHGVPLRGKNAPIMGREAGKSAHRLTARMAAK